MRNKIQQWLEDLKCLSDMDTERWQAFRHTYQSNIYTQTELAEQLTALGSVTGWLTETGRVVRLQNELITLEQLPLAGEFYQDTLHWQLTRLPRGRWELHRHELVVCQAAEATHLGELVEHIAKSKGGGRLCYWRLWQPKSPSQACEDPSQACEDPSQACECNIALLSAIKGVSL